MTANAGQIEYWNGPSGELWVRNQRVMDASLADATAALLPLAAIKPGERVLDIGCGSGETSLLAADKIGAGGQVTGVDISRPLLALARQRAQGRGNVRYVEADAASHAFAPDHDLLLSRFGMMFFDDPQSAFANIRKAAASGGRLAFVCWRPVAENEYAAMPFEIAKPLMPPLPSADPHAPGPFALSDPERLRGILAGAGYAAIGIEKLDGVMRMGATPEQAGVQATSLGPTARALARLADSDLNARVLAAVTEAFRAYEPVGGQIVCRIACWLVSARA